MVTSWLARVAGCADPTCSEVWRLLLSSVIFHVVLLISLISLNILIILSYISSNTTRSKQMATRRNKFIKLSGGFHSVFRKISKHFCGMRDCRCGGIHRNLIAEECNG